MVDLTLHEYGELSEEDLSQALQEERTKMFGDEAIENCFGEGPITLYPCTDCNPGE